MSNSIGSEGEERGSPVWWLRAMIWSVSVVKEVAGS